MTELDHAMSDLAFIHDRLAASTRFRGFAPLAVALTGAMAVALAAGQVVWPDTFGGNGVAYVAAWTAAALAAGTVIAVEALGRARRLHGGLADQMMASTLRLLLPFGAAGAAVALVVAIHAPGTIWILPGLWQLLVALIGFAAIGTLPRAIVWAAAWYFACGVVTLLLGARGGAATPWMMGVPFGVGQLLSAGVLHRAGGDDGRR